LLKYNNFDKIESEELNFSMEITEGKLKEILENQRKEYQDYIFNLRKKIAEDTEKIRMKLSRSDLRNSP